jgi:hypothetical protein
MALYVYMGMRILVLVVEQFGFFTDELDQLRCLRVSLIIDLSFVDLLFVRNLLSLRRDNVIFHMTPSCVIRWVTD